MSDPAPVSRVPDPREPSKIGPRLREQRKHRGASLRELADKVGVSPSLISQIERDKVTPSVSTLWALVTELGLTMGDVFAETGQSPARVTPPAGPVATPQTRS